MITCNDQASSVSMVAFIAGLNDSGEGHIGYHIKYSAVVSGLPEVADLNIALEPWNKVYLPLALR